MGAHSRVAVIVMVYVPAAPKAGCVVGFIMSSLREAFVS